MLVPLAQEVGDGRYAEFIDKKCNGCINQSVPNLFVCVINMHKVDVSCTGWCRNTKVKLVAGQQGKSMSGCEEF